MTQVTDILETLWMYDKVVATTILSNAEKLVVITELRNSLPHPMHATLALGTRDIVANHLNPPSPKDEAIVANPSTPRPPKTAPLSNGDHSYKKEQSKKAGSSQR